MALTSMVKDDVRFERVTGTIGAVVSGVALTGGDRPETAERLRRGLHEHGVLFFEFGQAVSAPDFAAFATLFGEPEQAYKFGAADGGGGAQFIDSDVTPMKDVRINHWHADGTALERPPRAAMLTPAELPEVGGDTMWASMYAAYEALSSHDQRLLDGLEVLHSTVRVPFLNQAQTAVHPAVIRDPVTGRKMLYVNANWSERVVGMGDHESEALLQRLFAHINTPEFHVRLRWRLGVVAVWEERVTQHRGVADFTGPRKLRRITFAGDRPAA